MYFIIIITFIVRVTKVLMISRRWFQPNFFFTHEIMPINLTFIIVEWNLKCAKMISKGRVIRWNNEEIGILIKNLKNYAKNLEIGHYYAYDSSLIPLLSHICFSSFIFPIPTKIFIFSQIMKIDKNKLNILICLSIYI